MIIRLRLLDGRRHVSRIAAIRIAVRRGDACRAGGGAVAGRCGTHRFTSIRSQQIPAAEIRAEIVAIVSVQFAFVVVLAQSVAQIEGVTGATAGDAGTVVRADRVVATLRHRAVVQHHLAFVHVWKKNVFHMNGGCGEI